jgi:hypothetical protein
VSEDLIVVQIAQTGTDRLRVTIVAATEMSFDILTSGGDYTTLIADLCRIAPVMMRYDIDCMEAGDDAGRTQPKPEDRRAINVFVRKYAGRIKNARVGFGEFARLEAL